MKKLLTVLVLLFITIVSNSQRLFNDLSFNTPSNVYTSPPVNEYKELNRKASEDYENNRNYKNKMIDFILELKGKTNDKQLLDALEIYYNQLEEISCCYQDKGYQLDKIHLGIKEAIIKHNSTNSTNLSNKNYTNQNSQLTDVACNTTIINNVVSMGYILDRVNPLTLISSEWLNSVAGYILDGKVFVIAEIKDVDATDIDKILGTNIKKYVFCNIPNGNWNNFYTGISDVTLSYGERFHKYIFDYKCTCN